MACALLTRFGSFAGVLAAPLSELRQIEHLGEAAVATLNSIQAAALRLLRAGVTGRSVLANWDGLEAYLNATLARERVHQLWVLFLDNRGHMLADEVYGRGTVNHTQTYPREVIKRVLELQSSALILVHNHPSGDTTPSADDIAMTAELKAAADVFGVTVYDHLIVGCGPWYSFRQRGLL